MRRIIALALGAVATFAVGLGSVQAQEKFRLPFPYIFSGPLIEFGERVWNEGILPGVEKINKEGGIKGKQLEFYKVDTRFPETAQWLADFRRLCDDKTVPVIFSGGGATKSVVAIFEDAERCGMPVFAPSAAGSWPFPNFGKYMFRYQPITEDYMPELLKKAHAKYGFKSAAASHTLDDDFAVANIKITRKVLGDLGVKIVSDQSFKTKESNFASQVSAHRAGNPDILIMHHQPGDSGTFLLQLRERGMEQRMIADATIGGADLWKLSQGKALGSLGASIWSPDDPRPIVQDWIKLWREKTGRKDQAPDSFVTTYFDAVQVLAKLLNGAKDLSRESIREAFATTKNLETISGPVTWNGPGEAQRSASILVEVGENGVLKIWK
ncbi:MAG: ABC transporter substrate-binding protein [Alphaproteobacteria bacterium]|nr:ABC transporter substrate-binding protein [Alphaproteobacteria bacterium]